VTHPDFDEVRDITVIGAGPVGLSAAFWAGMREASSRIIDSLPELGGQLTTLYPEKWIYDVPGHPKILARDLVELHRQQTLEQFDVPVHLETTAETISWEDDVVVLHTDKGDLRSRTVIVAGGHGAFEPKKLPGYDMTAWEGRGAYYLVGSKSEFEGKRVVIIGGGDSACDWVVNLLDASHSCTAARASAPTRPRSRRSWTRTPRGGSICTCRSRSRRSPATARSSGCSCSTPSTRSRSSTSSATRSCCSSGSRPRSGR
jgi:thioredoxin reductase